MILGIVLGLVVLVPVCGLLFVYFVLAPRNKFFTFVSEGSAKVVVKGDQVVKILIQWRDHGLDADYNVDGREERHRFGGLRVYGFWPIHDIFVYPFKWTGISPEGEIVEHPREWLDYIILKDDAYFFRVEKAEDMDKLPLDVDVLVTARIVNPYKALFVAENWLELTVHPLRAAIRNVVTTKTYEELITSPEAIGAWIEEQLSIAGDIRQSLVNDYGVQIVRIQILDINPPDEYRETTLRKFEATMEKEAIETRADAEVERLRRVYAAVQQFGDVGKLIRTLEAVEKSELSASLAVHAVPGLSEVLRGVFGGERYTSQQITELKEMLERIEGSLDRLIT